MKRTPLITIIVLIGVIIVLMIQGFQTKQELEKQSLIVKELVEKSNRLDEEKRLAAEINILQKILQEQTIDSLKKELDGHE